MPGSVACALVTSLDTLPGRFEWFSAQSSQSQAGVPVGWGALQYTRRRHPARLGCGSPRIRWVSPQWIGWCDYSWSRARSHISGQHV